MSEPKTLVQITGRAAVPCRLGESALIMIDCQNTYTTGRMTLSGIEAALEEAARLLGRARAAGTPIIHVMHDGGPGSLYDLRQEIGQIAEPVAPLDGEATIVKTLPNAFAGTELHERLQDLGLKTLIVAGFMTHMCVSSTVRAGFDLGYRTTVVGGATATRDLPKPDGGILPAKNLHEASLAGLSDLFAVVVARAEDLPV
jgi:nicotinamidase-related amidase